MQEVDRPLQAPLDAQRRHNDSESSARRRLGLAALAFALSFPFLAELLERKSGIPVDTTYRILCAALCLFLVYESRFWLGNRGWAPVVFMCLVVNTGIFFTPLVDRPLSRGELMVFAIPDGIIVLIAALAMNRSLERTVRLTLLTTVVVFIGFCIGLAGLVFAVSHR